MKPLGGKRTRVLDVEIYDRPRATAEKELTKKTFLNHVWDISAEPLVYPKAKERKKEREKIEIYRPGPGLDGLARWPRNV
jgi:hypothetical protein